MTERQRDKGKRKWLRWRSPEIMIWTRPFQREAFYWRFCCLWNYQILWTAEMLCRNGTGRREDLNCLLCCLRCFCSHERNDNAECRLRADIRERSEVRTHYRICLLSASAHSNERHSERIHKKDTIAWLSEGHSKSNNGVMLPCLQWSRFKNVCSYYLQAL